MFENTSKSNVQVMQVFRRGVPTNICFVYQPVYWADIDIHCQTLARPSQSYMILHFELFEVFTDKVDFLTSSIFWFENDKKYS